jgi:hypothetical protein
MEKNGNGVFIKSIFWTLILASFAWTTAVLWCGSNRATAIETSSLSRDKDESTLRELLGKDITRIDTNQVATMKNVEKILSNQDSMVKTLTRLETKIEKIQ